MDIDQVKQFMAEPMQRVDQVITQRLASDVALVNQLSQYIIHSGGKRLRPMLVMLSSGLFMDDCEHDALLAAVIEFIHTATLLHDDVVDASELRRGNETANTIWGNEAAVLVGDFLYSRAFQMMVEADSMPIMNLLADTTNIIAEGEVLQLMNQHDADTSEASYINVIHCKTSQLFAAATEIGARLSGQKADITLRMKHYGMHLGTAFQLMDDLLDYTASSEAIGKNIGDDLAEGKPTLPLIHAMRNAPEGQSALIRKAIENGDVNDIASIQKIIQQCGSIDYTREMARQEAQHAQQQLTGLATNQAAEILHFLADYAHTRTY